MTILRIVAAMLFLGGASAGGVYLFGAAKDAVNRGASFAGEPIRGLVGGGYSLSELELLESTLYHVEESYVEPGRIDFEAMYDAGLKAVARRVPTCMFRREEGASMLHVQIGSFQTVLEVPEIESSVVLRREMRKIAGLIGEHVNVDDIALRDPNDDPFAQIEYSLVNGVLSTLDPHSLLLPPVDSRQMDADNKGEFGGLGITIVDREGKLTVEYPLKDTPAEREGLQPDDHIVRIDGETTINMSLEEAVRKLRGPVGAPVVIHIMRQGLTEPLRVRIVRARIKLNPVEGQLLDGGVGWVSIKSFHANVDADLSEQLSLLSREAGGKLKGVVLDLRGNPGGYLTQAIAVSNRFLNDGVIVSTVDGRGREGARETARARNTEPNYPVAILLDASSASASEIVAGALRNNERAIVIGERSFGKGSVQNLHPFFDQSKLKLTISKYLTPGGRSIQSVGIPADIEMLPVIVEARDKEAEVGTDIALLYWRERVRREADLDKRLEKEQSRDDKPSYSFEFLRPKDVRRRSADVDLSNDQQVQFARDILLAAPSSRRPEMLAASHRVVKKYEDAAQAEIVAAFKNLGIDWRAGPSRESAELEVKMTMSGDDSLQAGSYELVRLEVTNKGSETLYQLGALTSSENQILDDGEFFFGKLAPGDTRYFERRVWVLTGYPNEEAPLDIQFRDVENDTLATHRLRIPVKNKPLPKLNWSWKLDDTSTGNGDGVIQIGEVLDLVVEVTNKGDGPTAEAFARIKNKSGRAIDIRRGTLEPGYMVKPDGQRCVPILPGIENGQEVGDTSKDPERVEAGDPPTYDQDCSRVLAQGETWTGSFQIVAESTDSKPLQVEVTVGDAEAYDHASVMRMGFYGYFTNAQDVEFRAGDKTEVSPLVKVPDIQITRKPPLSVDAAETTISGVVRDDRGVARVMIYHGDNKVFFEGSGRNSQLKSIPFSADVSLKPGLNTITVLVTDSDGAKATASSVVYFAGTESQADRNAPSSVQPN